MSAPYRADVNAGAYSLISQDGDPVGYGLADPLELSFSVPNSDLAPLVQRDPDEATINVIAPNASTYVFNQGDPVRATVYSSHASSGNNYAFFGRIAQLQAQPHKLGILYTLTCVDYLADLAELKAGRVDYPAESSYSRLSRMLAENGIAAPNIDGSPATGNPLVKARVAADEGVGGLLELVEEVLAGWTESQVNNETGTAQLNTITARYELVPNIVNPGGVAGQGFLSPTVPFKLSPIYRPSGWSPPARLNAVGNVHLTVATADSSPSTQNLTLDAGAVDFAPVFTQQKGNAVTRVVVQTETGFAVSDWTNWGVQQYLPAAATIEATVKTVLNSLPLGLVAAGMYKGTIQPDGSLQWTVGVITWRASRTQASGWQGPMLRRLCAVARVDALNSSSHVPTGKPWLAGVVDSLRVRVEAGEVTVGFTLAPMTYTATGFGIGPLHQATYTVAGLVGVTFAQLSPTDTFTDYLLLHD